MLEKIKNLYTKVKNRTVGTHELSSVYFKQVNGTLVIKCISVIISLIYVPIVLGFLDQEKYGIWVTLTTIVRWIRLADMGIGGGMRLKLSEAIALKQYQKGRMHVSTTYGIVGGIFIFILIVFHIINPHLNWQNILNSALIPQFELVRLASITVSFIVLGFILKTVTSVYLAHGNSMAEGFIDLIMTSVTLLLIWLVSKFADKGNLILLAIIVTGIPFFAYIVFSIYTFYYKYPHLKPSYKLIKVKESRSLLVLSLQSFMSTITYFIIYGSLPFVVTHLFGPNEVTVFNIAYSIFNVPILLIGLLVHPIKPLVTLAYTKRDNDWIRLMLRKLNIISLIIVVGTIIMILLNQFIYRLWIGDMVAIPYVLSVSIGIFTIINILQFPYSIIILGTGKMLINVILSPINIALFLANAIILSRLFNNVIGVSIALAFTCLVQLIVYPFWLKKQLSVN